MGGQFLQLAHSFESIYLELYYFYLVKEQHSYQHTVQTALETSSESITEES